MIIIHLLSDSRRGIDDPLTAVKRATRTRATGSRRKDGTSSQGPVWEHKHHDINPAHEQERLEAVEDVNKISDEEISEEIDELEGMIAGGDRTAWAAIQRIAIREAFSCCSSRHQ